MVSNARFRPSIDRTRQASSLERYKTLCAPRRLHGIAPELPSRSFVDDTYLFRTQRQCLRDVSRHLFLDCALEEIEEIGRKVAKFVLAVRQVEGSAQRLVSPAVT